MEDFNDLFNLDEINKVVGDKFRDSERKEVGDRVSIIDYSSVTRIDGTDIDELDEDMQFDADIHFIVIETRQKHANDVGYTTYNQDLIIVQPQTSMEYRVNSGHVHIFK